MCYSPKQRQSMGSGSYCCTTIALMYVMLCNKTYATCTADACFSLSLLNLVCLQLYLDRYTIASFPGHSHLQSLITNRGKAWENWSHVVTLCTHTIDRLPTKNIKALSCTISPRVRGQSISKAASMLFDIHHSRDRAWAVYHIGASP